MTQDAPTRSNFHSHLGSKMGNCPRRVVIHAHVDVNHTAKPDPEPALEQEGTAEPEVASSLASSDWDVIAATPEQRLRRVASFTRGRALPVLEGIALPLRRPVEQIPTAQQFASRDYRFYVVWAVPGHSDWAGDHWSRGARCWTELRKHAARALGLVPENEAFKQTRWHRAFGCTRLQLEAAYRREGGTNPCRYWFWV